MSSFFFFNDTTTTEIYTLSLHDALPILQNRGRSSSIEGAPALRAQSCSTEIARLRSGNSDQFRPRLERDRKSTRLNSSHRTISYAVFCLKKKKIKSKCRRSAQRHR